MSSSSVTSGIVGDCGVPSKCVCGLDVTIFTSKTQENPGRPFFRYISKRDVSSWTSKRDSHLFKWVEDAMFEEVEDALPRLAIIANELSKAKSEANELKAMIQEMKEEAMSNKMETRRNWCGLKVCFVWLFVITIVIVYGLFDQGRENKLVVGY